MSKKTSKTVASKAKPAPAVADVKALDLVCTALTDCKNLLEGAKLGERYDRLAVQLGKIADRIEKSAARLDDKATKAAKRKETKEAKLAKLNEQLAALKAELGM